MEDDDIRFGIVAQLRVLPSMKSRLDGAAAVVGAILMHDTDPHYQLFADIVAMLRETWNEEYGG